MRSKIANVLDLELTCWEGGIAPPGETAEIIEVGLTTVDLPTLTILKTFSIPVVPTRSRVSPYCTDLTGWTEAMLKRQGVPFAEAVRRLSEKYGGRNRLTVTDSDGECEAIRSQCALDGLAYPLGGVLNVSTLFELTTGQKSTSGLDRMLACLGMQFEGRRHRGADDSRNIARVFTALLGRTRFDIGV